MLTKNHGSVKWMTGCFRHLGVTNSVRSDSVWVATATMGTSLVLKPPERIVRMASDSWQDGHQKKEEGFECVKLTEQGCPWDASAPDNRPFNGIFHSTAKCCWRCRKGEN